MYLFGADNQNFHPIALRFDSTKKKWLDLKAPPTEAVVRTTHVKVLDHIYQFCGVHVTKQSGYKDHLSATGKCIKYSIKMNSWINIQNAPVGLMEQPYFGINSE